MPSPHCPACAADFFEIDANAWLTGGLGAGAPQELLHRTLLLLLCGLQPDIAHALALMPLPTAPPPRPQMRSALC